MSAERTGGEESNPRSPHRTTARTKARRRAVDVVFEADQRGGYSGKTLRRLLAERMTVTTAQTVLPQYSADIVEGVASHWKGIDRVLSTYLQGWTLDRLPSVDRAILRTATWELLFNRELDAPVVITEALNLAQDLSTDESPAFVNALLDRLRVLAPVLAAEIEAEEEAEAARLAAIEQRRVREAEYEAAQSAAIEQRRAREAEYETAQTAAIEQRRAREAEYEAGPHESERDEIEQEVAELLGEDAPPSGGADPDVTERSEHETGQG